MQLQQPTFKQKSYRKLFKSHPWKLSSIYESDLAAEKTVFNDIQVVFGPMHIYAMFGNKTEKFPYEFLSEKVFKIEIDNHKALCRIEKATDTQVIVHADYRDAHFIIELNKA